MSGAPKKFDASRLAQVLVEPIVSEKATHVAEKHNQVLFKVLRDATKPEIKAAVELMFKVEVDAVRTVNQRGKEKRFGRSIGRRDPAGARRSCYSLEASPASAGWCCSPGSCSRSGSRSSRSSGTGRGRPPPRAPYRSAGGYR